MQVPFHSWVVRQVLLSCRAVTRAASGTHHDSDTRCHQITVRWGSALLSSATTSLPMHHAMMPPQLCLTLRGACEPKAGDVLRPSVRSCKGRIVAKVTPAADQASISIPMAKTEHGPPLLPLPLVDRRWINTLAVIESCCPGVTASAVYTHSQVAASLGGPSLPPTGQPAYRRPRAHSHEAGRPHVASPRQQTNIPHKHTAPPPPAT